MASINPYLNFDGTTEEAFNFYRGVFGGDFSNISRFKDMPDNGGQAPTEGDKILHVALPIGNSILMGSDRPSQMGPATKGNHMHISLHPETEEEAHHLFNALAAEGNVTMPISKTFWNATFGMLKDKFGVQWMINYEHPQD